MARLASAAVLHRRGGARVLIDYTRTLSMIQTNGLPVDRTQNPLSASYVNLIGILSADPPGW